MISRLRGQLAGRTPTASCSTSTASATCSRRRRARCAAEGGGEAVVETYLHVREDALQLYGFADAAERQLFLHLLTVAGIGPKVALAIVSGSPTADLRRGDRAPGHGALPGVPGVGKKTAERIVLELKEKLGDEPVPISAAAGTSAHDRPRRASSSSATRSSSRAGARRRRSRPAGRGARPAGAEAGGMTGVGLTEPAQQNGGAGRPALERE